MKDDLEACYTSLRGILNRKNYHYIHVEDDEAHFSEILLDHGLSEGTIFVVKRYAEKLSCADTGRLKRQLRKYCEEVLARASDLQRSFNPEKCLNALILRIKLEDTLIPD
jgi:hypothetical protein